jgi:hypothetical protein
MYDTRVRLAALALIEGGASIASASRTTGVSRATLRDWLCNGVDPAPGTSMHKCVHCRHEICPDESASAYLLGLYLGDGCISRTKKPGIYVMRISCDDNWPGLMDRCENAMRDVLARSVHRVKSIGCHQLTSSSKHWPCLFPQHGPGGSTSARSLSRTGNRRSSTPILARSYAGCFHSDGCRCTNVVKRPLRDGARAYSYPRYFFSNESTDILSLCGAALDRLGVAWRYNRSNSISVARREAVALLDEHVGPKY